MRALAFLLVLATAVAGCSDGDGGEDAPAGDDGATTMPGGGSSASGTTSGAPGAPPTGNGAPTTHESVMRSNRFEPADLAVRVGDTVHWTTEDVQAHNVVSESEAASFRSEDVSIVPAVYAQEFSYTFNTPGTVDYVCEYHSGMVGTITVTA